jgi:hypothetical protein
MAGEVGGDLDLSIYPGYEQEGMCRRFYHRQVKVAGIDLSMYPEYELKGICSRFYHGRLKWP